MRHIRYSATAALAALALAAACKKAPAPPPPAETQPAAPAPVPEPKVSEIQVGRALGPDKRVLSPLATFGPKDTIFASVVTENVPAGAKLAAKWTFQTGQIVDTTTQAVAAASSGQVAVTEFHIVKPSGWPAGKYNLEISLDGKPSGTQHFEVKK